MSFDNTATADAPRISQPSSIYIMRAKVTERDRTLWHSWHGYDGAQQLSRRIMQYYLSHTEYTVLKLVMCTIVRTPQSVFVAAVGGKVLRDAADEVKVYGSRATAELDIERITSAS